jgi:parallel beta-helix repeat protein
MMNWKTLLLTTLFVWTAASAGRAETDQHTLTCDGHKTIGESLKGLKPGDTLVVSGSCNENVVIGEEVHGITLDGRGAASIQGDSRTSTITILGTGITIHGFTITGGAQGVGIQDGASAVVDGNTIQHAVMNGITVYRNSTALITNNTIQNNLSNGIIMQLSASARIGFTGPPTNRISMPNTIQNNGAQGIQVLAGSSAQIYFATIQNNAGSGVVVDRNSSVQIGFSAITGNVGDGVRAMRNSGIDLERNTGTNGGYGARCTVAGFMGGVLGTLTGTLGGKTSGDGCTDSLAP